MKKKELKTLKNIKKMLNNIGIIHRKVIIMKIKDWAKKLIGMLELKRFVNLVGN
jgi:hypothetical protein